MNKAGGFITLQRQILEWQWFKDTNTLCLFIYLLLSANFKDGKFMGKKIKRGQIATSLPSLAAGTGLSIQNVRTALKHLISTGEVTDNANRKYRIITIVKYNEYQNLTDNLTDNQQTTNRQLTDNQQQYNNDNNVTKKQCIKSKRSASHFTPPSVSEVQAYCQERRNGVDAERFVDYYSARGWVLKSGQKMKDWKSSVRLWEKRNENEQSGHGESPAPGGSSEGRSDYSWLRSTIIDL